MKRYSFLILFILFALLSSHDLTTGAKTPICSVDVSAAHELTEFSEQIPPLCEKTYPKIAKILRSPGFTPPAQVKLIFTNMKGVAFTECDRIELSVDYFKGRPDDLGAIVHELVHVVQNYSAPHPDWLREGIADHIRYELGYRKPWSYSHCENGETYTAGYGCGAAFLEFLEKNHKPKKVINTLNEKIRRNLYSDTIFNELTGKSLDELWQDCLRAGCYACNK